MRGIGIHDQDERGCLAFDLKEILDCLGQDVLDRTWICSEVECTGKATEELKALRETCAPVSGQRLIQLAQRTSQVIWGEFFGRLPGESTDSLVVKAIDSSWWEVFGNDDCLLKVGATFLDARIRNSDAG